MAGNTETGPSVAAKDKKKKRDKRQKSKTPVPELPRPAVGPATSRPGSVPVASSRVSAPPTASGRASAAPAASTVPATPRVPSVVATSRAIVVSTPPARVPEASASIIGSPRAAIPAVLTGPDVTTPRCCARCIKRIFLEFVRTEDDPDTPLFSPCTFDSGKILCGYCSQQRSHCHPIPKKFVPRANELLRLAATMRDDAELSTMLNPLRPEHSWYTHNFLQLREGALELASRLNAHQHSDITRAGGQAVRGTDSGQDALLRVLGDISTQLQEANDIARYANRLPPRQMIQEEWNVDLEPVNMNLAVDWLRIGSYWWTKKAPFIGADLPKSFRSRSGSPSKKTTSSQKVSVELDVEELEDMDVDD